jgi:hypothetical protein
VHSVAQHGNTWQQEPSTCALHIRACIVLSEFEAAYATCVLLNATSLIRELHVAIFATLNRYFARLIKLCSENGRRAMPFKILALCNTLHCPMAWCHNLPSSHNLHGVRSDSWSPSPYSFPGIHMSLPLGLEPFLLSFFDHRGHFGLLS